MLTTEDKNSAPRQANQKPKALEKCIEALKLDKAGEVKYQKLKKSNKLPPAPARVKTQLEATLPLTAPKADARAETSASSSLATATSPSTYSAG